MITMLLVDLQNDQSIYKSKNTMIRNRDAKLVCLNSFAKYYLYRIFGPAKVGAHCHRFCVAATYAVVLSSEKTHYLPEGILVPSGRKGVGRVDTSMRFLE